ncbi:MAG: homoserine kinase [Nitrososphaerota archaeon]|nr:homoserine kinase [Nitrososphaerota archaeon]
MEAPASSANLGCGFDTFALALEGPKDRLALEKEESQISLKVRGPRELAEDPAGNVAVAVASVMMGEYRLRGGVAMSLTKGVPVGLGLGSSAATSVATAAGIDRLFGLRLSETELITFAGVGEKAASGTAHYDNVAASFAGGFVVVRWDHSFVRMEPPKSMALCLVTPRVKLPREKTKFARSLLPKQVRLERAVAVTRATSMMVHGFATGSLDEIGDAMEVSLVDDRRAVMVPGFERVRLAALSSGAFGTCISGAGPTLLAVAEWRLREKVIRGMVKAFRSEGIESSGFATGAGGGCRIRAA